MLQPRARRADRAVHGGVRPYVLRSSLPRVRYITTTMIRYLLTTAYARSGTRVFCVCCGRRSRRFLPFGDPPGPHALCPWCGSLERQRVLWPYLQRTVKPGARVLHFSPEPVIARNIATLPGVSYTAADLNPSNPWLPSEVPIVRADITDQPWPDRSFDVVIVSHVLEFVPDDVRGMTELRRVLADDGIVVSQEPYDPERERTLEFPLEARGSGPITGDRDHVRLYGQDLTDRWEKAGFKVRRLFADAGPDNEIFEAAP